MSFSFEVSVFSGSNLDKKESPSRLQIKCGPATAETAAKKLEGASIEWNETFFLSDCPDTEPIIFFRLKGKGAEPVAVGEIAVNYLKEMGEWRGDVPLRGSKGPAGSISVRCVMDSGARPPHGHHGGPGGSRGGFGHRS